MLEKPTLKRVGLKQGRFGSRCKQSRSNSFFELSSRPRTKVFIYTFSSLLPSTSPFLCNLAFLVPTVGIKLLSEHLQTICTHAESTYPEECCGVILGYLTDGGKIAVEVVPTANAWNTEGANFPDHDPLNSPKTRYAIASRLLLQLQREGRDRDLNIIGIYHSHPNYPPTPSECDRLYAWSEYSYIIVSVQNGKASEFQSWSLDEYHQFQSETIEQIT